VERQVERTVRWFRETDPTFVAAFTPALLVAALLYVRSPASNYIFDEQEALLANPYVNGQGLGYWDAFSRDFWGLPPTRSIGSYRPIPNLIWRALWVLSDRPWLHHWVNVVFHAVNAALISSLTLAISRQRRLAWLSGGVFLLTAVLTEAVTGVVGIADVLGGCGVLLALVALRLPLLVMPLGVFAALAFGLLCKESGLVALPLVPWAALVLAPMLHPRRPGRLLRAALALVGAAGALVAYTYFRRHFFPVTLPAELQHPLPDSEPLARRLLHDFLRWFQQPRLPQDPINNPLVNADFPHRVAGALRVYWRGITQVILPLHLSGDYSFQQEPIPARLFGLESVLGGCAMLCPPLAAAGYWVYALVRERRERRTHREAVVRDQADSEPATPSGPPAWSGRLASASLVAVGLLWVPVAYFPHSNIPVLLPTVRAERFWYLPAIGSAWLVAVLVWWLLGRTRWRRLRWGVVGAFFCFQAVQARLHALDYTNDLVFWRSTRRSSPNSAKAHLNYSVMVGARGRLEERLRANQRAIDLAPQWAMAHVYYGDTLCRLKRADEAWPHYVRGFELDPNSQSLVALALQCLWDKKAIADHDVELLELSDRHPGTWLAYLGREIVYNGKKHGGVEKKYRPRGYDEGPKKR
jgi:tetratricopeptide (TPR) repeat protein